MRNLPAFTEDGLLNVIVESPRGSSAKFKWMESAGLFMLSRPLPTGLVYPCDWGFIPGTRAGDGDPLDAFVLWDGHAYPGVLLQCRVLGMLRITQRPHASGATERNDRIAAIPASDARARQIESIDDLPERGRRELEQFFQAVVAFEPKTVTIEGWGSPDEAMEAVRVSSQAGSKPTR
jgi:inorganic pyrophosphatase